MSFKNDDYLFRLDVEMNSFNNVKIILVEKLSFDI